jgi:hypothetical protein
MASKAKNNDSSERAEAQEQDRSLDLTREEKIRRRAYEIYLERGGSRAMIWSIGFRQNAS